MSTVLTNFAGVATLLRLCYAAQSGPPCRKAVQGHGACLQRLPSPPGAHTPLPHFPEGASAYSRTQTYVTTTNAFSHERAEGCYWLHRLQMWPLSLWRRPARGGVFRRQTTIYRMLVHDTAVSGNPSTVVRPCKHTLNTPDQRPVPFCCDR